MSNLSYYSQITFLSVIQVFEVDVFEHPRFWDEFSHVLNRRFLSSVSFRGLLTSIPYMLLRFLSIS